MWRQCSETGFALFLFAFLSSRINWFGITNTSTDISRQFCEYPAPSGQRIEKSKYHRYFMLSGNNFANRMIKWRFGGR